MGRLSFGSSGTTGGVLYDITDEYEAFARESFFGGKYFSRNEINDTYLPRGVSSESKVLGSPVMFQI